MSGRMADLGGTGDNTLGEIGSQRHNQAEGPNWHPLQEHAAGCCPGPLPTVRFVPRRLEISQRSPGVSPVRSWPTFGCQSNLASNLVSSSSNFLASPRRSTKTRPMVPEQCLFNLDATWPRRLWAFNNPRERVDSVCSLDQPE